MVLRPFLFPATACASYLFGCLTHRPAGRRRPACRPRRGLPGGGRASRRPDHGRVRDPRPGRPRVGASGARRGGRGDGIPAGRAPASTSSTSRSSDGEVVELGNTVVRALATPGHAPAHNAYLVADRRRGTEEPWLVFTGDSLLIGDVGRPDLHAGGSPEPAASELHGSSSVCSSCPITSSSTRATTAARSAGAGSRAIRFPASASSAATTQRSSIRMRPASPRRCSATCRPPPAEPARIVEANRRGKVPTRT